LEGHVKENINSPSLKLGVRELDLNTGVWTVFSPQTRLEVNNVPRGARESL